MNREEIIRMARKAELIYDEECTSPWVEDTNLTPFLERFATLVASAEREACAKVIESHGPFLANGALLVEAIRARGDV